MLDIWGDGGLVSQVKLSDYSVRPEQIDYSGHVTQALISDRNHDCGIVLLEGGTGIGKTLGYLVPACLEIAERGGRVLISTHTLALMRQIAEKEAPIAFAVARAAHGKQLRLAELRGRKNFASPLRCRAFAAHLADVGNQVLADAVLLLARQTETADRLAAQILDSNEEVLEYPDVIRAALIDRFAADRGIAVPVEEICLLPSSEMTEQAPYLLGNKAAKSADVLVTTHAMTAIALARRTVPGAGGETYRALILDEADRWAKAAEAVAFSFVSLEGVDRNIEKLMQTTRETPVAKLVAFAAVAAIDAVNDLKSIAPTTANSSMPLSNSGVAALEKLRKKLLALIKIANSERKITASAAGFIEGDVYEIERVLKALNSSSEFWRGDFVSSRVFGKPGIRVVSAAPGRVLKRLWSPAEGESPLAQSIILTSATLGTPGFDGVSRWMAVSAETGVPISDEIVHSDLFASIHPTHFGEMRFRFADPEAPIPSPGTTGEVPPDALQYIVDTIREARKDGGRTLVQVPAYDDVDKLSPFFNDAILHRRGNSLLEALDAYRSDPSATLITPAIWAGVDLPGLVDNQVIPRLPFPPHEAAESSFLWGAALSQMLHALAQGLGRGIRRPTDKVTVWIADPRFPPPDELLEREMILPHPSSSPRYLSAIPERFRRTFTQPGIVDFGIRVKAQTKGSKL